MRKERNGLKRLYFFFAIFIAVALDATVLNYFRIFNVKPDIFLIGVIIASLIFDLRWALFFSILLGILKDAFCLGPFAFNVLLFGSFSFLIIKLSRKISIENNFMRIALVLTMAILSNLIARMSFVYSGKFVALGIFLRTSFLECLYTALVSVLVFRFIRPIFQS